MVGRGEVLLLLSSSTCRHRRRHEKPMRHGSLTVVVPPSEAPSLFRFSFCFVFFFSFSSNYEL